ncbi:GerMN domain-containing protein [uncultured Clostridium sp.]|uniref:GerMN domain-containing protein n=1 Tax=uncultured Clostridium sp. TaxID=59620 RepID=UPI0028E33B0C|nr:GerMN domain-containing protein [uncultured Clostridium sp.]
MKNAKKFLAILLIPALLLVGCGKGKNSGDNKKPETSDKGNIAYTIKDYYPFKENIKIKYKGIGSEFAEKTVFTDYIRGNKVQLRVVNPGTTSAQVLEIKDGELRLITSKEEYYHRDSIIDIENKNYEILLKEPLIKGTTWSLPNGSKRFVSDIEKEVETPAGKFKALEVTTENADYTSYDYYVLNKGLIKSIYKAKDLEVITTLESIEENAPVTQTVKFYYSDYAEDKIYFINKTLKFNTNDDVKAAFEKEFKENLNANITKLIGDKVSINKIYLDSNTNTAKIDLSSNFVKEMNAGSGYEMALLKCITNTLGNYYNVDKTTITLDDKPYSSGHISMKENEPIKVDYENVKEYKK